MIWGLSILRACSALVQINGIIYSGEDVVTKVTRDIKARLPADLADSAVGEAEGFYGHENRYPDMNIAEHAARTMLASPFGSCKRVVYVDPTGLVLDETYNVENFYGESPCEEIEDVEATFMKSSEKDVFLNLASEPYLDWLSDAVYDITHRNIAALDFAIEVLRIYWNWIKDLLLKLQTSSWSL